MTNHMLREPKLTRWFLKSLSGSSNHCSVGLEILRITCVKVMQSSVILGLMDLTLTATHTSMLDPGLYRDEGELSTGEIQMTGISLQHTMNQCISSLHVECTVLLRKLKVKGQLLMSY